MIAECFDAIEPMLGTRAACAAAGRPRATHYRRQAPPEPRKALQAGQLTNGVLVAGGQDPMPSLTTWWSATSQT